MRFFVILCCMLSLSLQLSAQSPSPIIFIYDASGSMWGKLGDKTKLAIANEVLAASVNALPDDQPIGLVAYGHREKENCQDVEFLVEARTGAKSQIVKSLQAIKPVGKTPLAYSALQVINKLRAAKSKATIILVTDGIESCGGDLCEVVRAARAEGIDFRLHVIGFGLQGEETEALRCAAQAGEGRYYDAADAGSLTSVLNEATTATVDEPAANFSVFAVKNGKPIDAQVKALKKGKDTPVKVVRTYRDTVFIYLPPGHYDLDVRPLENSDVDAVTVAGVQSFADKATHQTVSFDAGKIEVMTLNNEEGWDASVTIYASGSDKRVAGGRTYGKADIYDLNPGLYDLELTALVIEGPAVKHRVEKVSVKAGEVTKVAHQFKSGIAMIGAKSASGLVDAVVTIKEANTKETVAGGRTYTAATSNPKKFVLNPGTYEVTLSALGDQRGKKETFTLVVKVGETVEKITTF